MLINCCECGRPLVEIEPPTLAEEANLLSSARRTLNGMFGIDLGPAMALLTNPTPEGVALAFKPRCPDGNHRPR